MDINNNSELCPANSLHTKGNNSCPWESWEHCSKPWEFSRLNYVHIVKYLKKSQCRLKGGGYI